MTEPELTPQAKDAIRSYMLKFVIPSSVLLTLVSGALGYVVSGLARIDASSEAAKYALLAAGDAAKANSNAVLAASQAADSRDRAAKASMNAETTQKYLLSVKDQVDKILTGQYEGLAKSLFAIPDFRSAVGTIGQTELGEINAHLKELDAKTSWSGGLIGMGMIKGGQIIASSPGIVIDQPNGRISFDNTKGLQFVPLASAISANGQYLTGSCYVREIGQNYFVLWAGAQDTSGRHGPPVDCTFAILGIAANQ